MVVTAMQMFPVQEFLLCLFIPVEDVAWAEGWNYQTPSLRPVPGPHTPANWKPLGLVLPKGFCAEWPCAHSPCAAGRGLGPCPLGMRRLCSGLLRQSSHLGHCG